MAYFDKCGDQQETSKNSVWNDPLEALNDRNVCINIDKLSPTAIVFNLTPNVGVNKETSSIYACNQLMFSC